MGVIARTLVSGAGRLVPLKSGLTRLAGSPVVRLGFRGGRREHLARLRNGLRVPVNLDDWNGLMLAAFGTPDPKVVGVCRALLRPGDGFLDIGANHGAVGLLCHDVVGPQGGVHLFEPQPGLCERIRWVLANEKVPNVTLHEVAVLDKEDQLELNVQPGHSGVASLVRGSKSGQRVVVPVKDVRTYLPPLLNGRPFGVKLDVEGVELPIVRGLATFPGLRFITLECNSPAEREPLWETIRGAGLALYGLARTLLTIRLRPLRSIEDMARYHDLVAVRHAGRDGADGEVTPAQLRRELADTALVTS